MDDYTFGNSHASVNLMRSLETLEYGDCKKTVAKILSKYYKYITALMFIPDKEVRETALVECRHGFCDWVDRKDFPEVIKTHTKCVIVGIYREKRRELATTENKEVE